MTDVGYPMDEASPTSDVSSAGSRLAEHHPLCTSVGPSRVWGDIGKRGTVTLAPASVR